MNTKKLTLQDCFKYPEAVDYLRSVNIDIDGLQEKGVAVYETL